MDLSVNGHRIYLETHGNPENQAVVLLHHGLGSSKSWKAQIPALLAEEFFVVAYDRWGYGRSDTRPSLDLPAFQEDIGDLVEILDRLDLERPALVGHSDGGTLALYFCAQFPHRVLRLLVVAAHIYIEAEMESGIREVYDAYRAKRKFRAGLHRLHKGKTKQVFRNWYEGWTGIEDLDWDMRPVLEQVICPVLVVQGEEDEHATPRHARDLAAGIPNAELWLAPGMGHMLPKDHPDQFNARMIAFLKQGILNPKLSGLYAEQG